MPTPRSAGKVGAELRMDSLLVAPLLRRVRAAGHDPNELIARFDLPPGAERDRSVVLSLATLRALFDAAERTIGDPFLGLHLAESLPRGTFGVVEFLCEAAPTVGVALQSLSRRHALLNDLVVVTVHERSDHVVVEQRIPGAPLCVGRHGNELFVANLVLQGRRLTGRSFVPRHAFFAHGAPPDVSDLVRVLGTADLRFGLGANGVALDAVDVDAKVITADGPLADVLDTHADGLLVARPPSKTFLDRVRSEAGRRLPAGPPTLDDVAGALRLSPRTLQRRLDQEGTTLSEIVEVLRQERARAFLLDRSRTVEAVALELGYGDARAFQRAFKRWTGTTPSLFRTR